MSQNSMGHQHQPIKFPSDEGSECSSVTSESLERYHTRGQDSGSHSENYNIKVILKQIQSSREEMVRLREQVETNKSLQQEVHILSLALQVRFYCFNLMIR